MSTKGNLSINSENILPIIKKWLYSDTDIFIRELVSNAADAITKLKLLKGMDENGSDENEQYRIDVYLDKEAKTITVSDNGIGMNAEEITKYITEIAFSGATDFLNKYQDKVDKDSDIIGHFGLGFYSSFMVADKVQIDSLSYRDGEQAAKWVCDGGIEYELSESDRAERGTTVTLFVGADGEEFLDEYKLREVLSKYCSFMPIEIYFTVKKTEEENAEEASADEVASEAASEEAGEADEVVQPKETPINETNPLWLKPAKDCTDEEYKQFYHSTFSDFSDPLFWIHLNMDYPFKLKGILYFPKLKHELESIEGQVKLYNNQVFIADNIKEVIPEFLLLLKGVIDCPDLPLNVSRSFLQNDSYVKKLSGYITKKVADKLNQVFKNDREAYNGYWEDINQFIKYGCIREKDFYDKVKEAVLFKTTSADYVTLAEFKERNKDKTGDKVFYVSDEKQQSQYIKLFKENELEAVVLPTKLDNPFISYLESYEPSVKFNRIDSDITEALKDKQEGAEENKEEAESVQKLFAEVLDKKELKVKTESLKSEAVSSVILLSEQSRRMQEMSKMFGGGMPMFANEETLVLNKNNSLIKTLLNMRNDEGKKDDVKLICEHVFDLAVMGHKTLDTDAMARFIERSNALMERVLKG